MVDIIPGNCQSSTCKYLESGICEKGHSIVGECEMFTPTSQQATSISDDQDAVSTPDNEDTEEFIHSFHNGQSLNLEDASVVTSEMPTQIVILAGDSESGKTTLLASIYEKFSTQDMEDYMFAGSKTLPGFEERCHLARIASGRSFPETERTKFRDEMDMLHLAVSKTDTVGDHINILITDLSGERFKMIKDSTTECKKMNLLLRADHFAFLIDGKMLSSKKLRQKAYSDCRSLLRSCVDAEMLGKHTHVEIIFSKWDLVEPTKEANENSKFVEYITEKISDEFGGILGILKFYKLASRPEKTETYPFGFQVEELFDEWANYNTTESGYFPTGDIQSEKLNGIDAFNAN